MKSKEKSCANCENKNCAATVRDGSDYWCESWTPKITKKTTHKCSTCGRKVCGDRGSVTGDGTCLEWIRIRNKKSCENCGRPGDFICGKSFSVNVCEKWIPNDVKKTCANCENNFCCGPVHLDYWCESWTSEKSKSETLSDKSYNNSRRENVSKLFDDRKRVFLDKNIDYGEAYIVSGMLFEKIFPEGLTIKTWRDHCAYQLMTRKMDKILRFCNLRFGKNKKSNVKEKISDTLGDDGVYSFMLAELEEDAYPDNKDLEAVKKMMNDPELLKRIKELDKK